MTRAYHPSMNYLILEECYADNDAIDPDALVGLCFEAPAPNAPDNNATATTLRYNGITRPPLGPNGLPDDNQPSLQVRILTGELDTSDIKVVKNFSDSTTSADDFQAPAYQALRAN